MVLMQLIVNKGTLFWTEFFFYIYTGISKTKKNMSVHIFAYYFVNAIKGNDFTYIVWISVIFVKIWASSKTSAHANQCDCDVDDDE